MKSSIRKPRWAQVGLDKSQSKSKSRSQRSRYTPKRSQNYSQNDFTLHHLQQTYLNSASQPVHPQNTRSILRQDSQNALSENKDRNTPQRQRATSLQADELRNKKILNIKQSTNLIKKSSTKIQDSLDNNFRDYLHTMENMQKQLQIHKTKIQQKLDLQQAIIEGIRFKIMQTFSQHAGSFTDPHLKKLISKHNSAKYSQQKTNKNQERVYLNARSPVTPRLQKQSPKHSISRSIKSNTGQACKNTFDRIFKTIQIMKKGLNQFKQIRVSTHKKKGPRKTSFRLKPEHP